MATTDLTLDQALTWLDDLLYAQQQQHFNTLQVALLRAAWEPGRQSYRAIAQAQGYSENYLKYDAGPKLWRCLSGLLQDKVRKTTVRALVEHRWQAQQGAGLGSAATVLGGDHPRDPLARSQGSPQHPISPSDWGPVPEVPGWQGRDLELARLGDWLAVDHCRLIAVTGLVGTGKTALVARVVRSLSPNSFAMVRWYPLPMLALALPSQPGGVAGPNPYSGSVTHPPVLQGPGQAPGLADLLADLVGQGHQQLGLSPRGNLMADGLAVLQHHRCLVVLDGWDSLLQPGYQAYHPSCQDYGQWLQCLAEVPHQSCLLIISRDYPLGLSPLLQTSPLIRCLPLAGLAPGAAQTWLEATTGLTAPEDIWQQMISRCGGNPLFLKMVCASARTLFKGQLSRLCDQPSLALGDLRHTLNQQLQVLPALELEILYWLAIYHEPVTAPELGKDLLTTSAALPILEGLATLVRRSLVDIPDPALVTQQDTLFTLHPTMAEYLIQGLIERVTGEILSLELAYLHSHALIKAQTKEYLRDRQKQKILRPIAQRLQATFHHPQQLELQLRRVLERLHQDYRDRLSYAPGNLLNLLCELGFNLRGYDFSHLMVWQADLQGMALQQVNFSRAHLARSVFTKTLGGALSVTFSPDGQRLATSDINGIIRLWQVSDGKQILTCEGHGSWVCLVAFSPDGQWLASASEDHTIKLWSTQTGHHSHSLAGHRSWVWAIAFSRTGQFLASASEDYTLRIWSLRSLRCLKILTGHNSWVCTVAFSPRGNLLASGGDDHLIRLWNLRTGQCLKILWGHGSRVTSVVFSPDGAAIASASEDKTVKLWSVDTGECLQTLRGHDHWVWSVAFSPEGDTLVSGSQDQTVKIWDRSTGACRQTLTGHSSWVQSVAFSPQGTAIASGSEDQTIRLWDPQTGDCLTTIRGYASWIQSVAFSPKGNLLASSSEDHTARLWDFTSGACLGRLGGPNSALLSVAFSPDGEWLAGAGFDHRVWLWQVSTGVCLRVLEGHSSWIRSVAFSPCGTLLVSAGGDCLVKIWDLNTGACLRTLRGHSNWVWCVAFSPDGRHLASCGDDQTVKLWDRATGKGLITLREHTSSVTSVAFSPDGSQLVSSSADQTIKLWDVETGICRRHLVSHSSAVFLASFSPDGQWLASGSADQTIKLWSVASGSCHQTLTGHTNLVFSVAFSPDGKLLASGSRDETIKLWRVDDGACWKTLRIERPYEGMDVSGVMGLTEAQLATLTMLGAVVKVK